MTDYIKLKLKDFLKTFIEDNDHEYDLYSHPKYEKNISTHYLDYEDNMIKYREIWVKHDGEEDIEDDADPTFNIRFDILEEDDD